MRKATVLPDISEYPQEKEPSQKASAAQTKHEKELKEERMQKSIKSLATYEKKSRLWDLNPPQSLHCLLVPLQELSFQW